jgi:hypothetical protein
MDDWVEFVKTIQENVEDADARQKIYEKLLDNDWAGGDGSDEALEIDEAFDAAHESVFGSADDEDEDEYYDEDDDSL